MVFVPIWCVCSRRGKGEEAKRDVIKEREGGEMDTDKRPPTGKLLRGIPERMGYQHRRAVVIIDDKKKTSALTNCLHVLIRPLIQSSQQRWPQYCSRIV